MYRTFTAQAVSITILRFLILFTLLYQFLLLSHSSCEVYQNEQETTYLFHITVTDLCYCTMVHD